ncbi:DNA helicase [Tanacetum coccineum]|uniref:ATP-dependent DNA helicase n=1 Tax=Tanacetum coccineum TaxID=301880 RepID=A0ABQ5A836_9ASTR
MLFSIHSDEWKSFQSQPQTTLRYKRRCCSLIPAESDSLPHAHAQTTKTYYKHQDSRIKKAQESKTKTSAKSDIKDPSLETKLQGKLLESFQEDAKYEHDVEHSKTLGQSIADCIQLSELRALLTMESLLEKDVRRHSNNDIKIKKIYDIILGVTTLDQQELIFVYGHGGTEKTFLWKMLISALRITEDEQKMARLFASWILDIGDSKIREIEDNNNSSSSWIRIPEEYCIVDDDASLSILEMLDGESTIYKSLDEAIPIGNDGGEVELMYPPKYIKTPQFSSFPPHELELKVGETIMLLRNMNLQGGMCNVTRMIIRSCGLN